MKCFQCAVIFILCAGPISYAQTSPRVESTSQTKTKLELFQARTGVVIIRGFSTIGSVKGRYGSSAAVESKEFIDASSGKKEYGITIQVLDAGERRRSSTSYIDYDEIDSLLKGIDYISKIPGSITKLSDFQADYRTRGELEISTFSAEGKILASVSSRSSGETSAYLEVSQLSDLRALIVKAKVNLDAIK